MYEHQFNEEDYDGHEDDEIKEEEDIFLLNCKMSMCNEIDFNVITCGIT